MQYGDTAIATLSTDALTLQSGTSLNAQKLTASNGIEITNHMTAENGVVTVTGKLTASNGIFVTNGAAFTGGGDAQFAVGIDAFFTKGLSVNSGVGQTIHLNAPITSDLTPSTDGTKDLGTSALQWGEAHVDHGHIDDITATGTSNLATVNVTGKLTASNGIAVTGDVSFDDANFSGDVTFGSAATDVTTVTGQLTASNGMNVTGDTRFVDDALFVSNVTLGLSGVADVHVNGKADFMWAITASNGIAVYNSLEDEPFMAAENGVVTVSGQLTASNGIYVNGRATYDDDVFIARDLTAFGDVELGNHAADVTRVGGQLTASNGLKVLAYGGSTIMTAENGVVTVSGKLTASNGIAVTGESTFSGDVLPGAVTNTLGDGSNQWAYLYSKGAEFDDANAMINMPGALVVSKSGNSTTISTKLTASNGISLTNHLAADNGVVTVSGQLTASNGLTVNGNVNFDDAAFSGDVSLGDGRTDVITVNGVATFTEQLTASNGIAVAGDATFAQRATFSGVTTVSAQLTASNGARIVGDVAIAGITTITGQLTASQGASITGDVLLGENDTIKAGVYITYSDATLKENIEVISNPIDKVMSMRGVTYNLKSSSGNPEVGFLAQEMKQAVPEVVYGNGDGNLGIDYAKLTSVLVEAIKTQQTQIQEQQSQIDELKDTLLKK